MTTPHREVALVTGGARGLGREIAASLAARGVAVGLVDAGSAPFHSLEYELASAADLDAARGLVEAHGNGCATALADVRDLTQVTAAIDRIEQELGPITMVVAAAAVGSVGDAVRLTDDQWDEVLDTNLHGFYNTARATAPRLVARGHGRILAVVGDEARRGTPGLSHLAAASWAVVGLAKSIALEVASAGVAVNVVCAGPLQSAFTQSAAFGANASRGSEAGTPSEALAARHPNGTAWVEAADAVSAALFLLGATGTSMTGSVIEVNNGMSALNSA